MSTKQIKAALLVEDLSLYPRRNVDETNISHIAEAMSVGADIPPVIIEAKTLRIVDGVHRCRAALRVGGDEAEITCILREYKTDADLFLDAVRLNANHGVNMDGYDRTHSMLIAVRLEIPAEQLAAVLNMRVEKVLAFKTARCAKMENTGRLVPIKTPVRHMAGKEITKGQKEVIEHLGGNHPRFLVSQLRELIRSDLIDRNNAQLLEDLRALADEIRRKI